MIIENYSTEFENVLPKRVTAKLNSMLNKVFVYGTLKPGLRFHFVAQQGGKFAAEEAFIEGFDLYHLRYPANYPAISQGTHRVYGWCFTYDDIDLAMPFLDELEGVDCDPPLYKRVQTQIYLKSGNSTAEDSSSSPLMTWVYVYQGALSGTDAATLLPNGLWLPREEDRERVMVTEVESSGVVVVKGQPLDAMDQSMEVVVNFLRDHGLVFNQTETVVVFPSPPPCDEKEVMVGVRLGHLCSIPSPLLAATSVPVPGSGLHVTWCMMVGGLYALYVYRGPSYGLDDAWTSFFTSLLTETEVQVVEGGLCFQISLKENTLAAGTKTRLYVPVERTNRTT